MPAVQAPKQPYVDARKLGVSPGDASVNVALNNAISIVSAAGGGVLWMPDGEYGCTDKIVIRDGVHLYAPGAVVTADASMGAVPMVGFPDSTGGHVDVGITGLTLDGNKANRTSVYPSSHGIALLGAVGNPNQRVRINGCVVKNQPGISIAVQNAVYWWVGECYVQDGARDGINSAGFLQHGFVTRNVVRGCMDDGIAMNAEFLGSSILRNVVAHNSVFVDRDKESWEVYYGSGITIRGGGHIRVAHNSVDAAFASGILLESTQYQGFGNVLIQGNAITDAGKRATTESGHGIAVDIGAGTSGAHTATADRINILDNAVRGSRTHGILVQAATGCTLTNIRVERNDLDGSGSTSVSRPTTGRGIYLTGNYGCTDLRVRMNAVRNHQSWGIDLGDGTRSVTRLRVEGNDVFNNNQGATSSVGGIRVRVAAGTTHLQDNVSKNTSGSSQSHGFVSVGCSGVGFSYANDFSGNATANVSIATDTTSWTPGAPS